jgi:hypothetical protein
VKRTCGGCLGGHFLVERGALESAGEVNHSLAVTGWDHQRRDCVADYVDSNGEQDTYRLGLKANDFTIDWAKFRFAGRLDESGDLITGTWQQAPDGANWEYWYDAELRRM